MANKPITDSKGYKYLQVQVRFRWVDYEKIRSVFPAFKDESAASYFKRLADKMQIAHLRGDI